MAQQKQKMNIASNKSYFLDTVIDCISQKNNSINKKYDSNNQQMNINNLYDKAGSIIANLDNEINRCKKYNEAKINRKYQIIITDLQSQIKKLSEKLKLEQDARSPTKKHISDLLDKLVIFRDENIKMKQQIQNKDQKIKQLQQKILLQTKALQKMQTQQPKTLIQRLPAISATSNLAQSVKNFLKDKQLVRKITKKSSSKLEKFLIQNKVKMWNWSIPNLLEQLQKFTQGITNQKNQVDMWRIRSSIANKFSNMIDNSGTLIKPSRLHSQYQSEANTARQNKINSSRNMGNYSYRGSKQKLNFSFV